MQKIKAEILALCDLTQADRDNFSQWVWRQRSTNLFQTDVMKAPRMVMCKALKGEDAALYVPLHPVLMFDAIASAPDLTPRQEALALWKIGQEADRIARDTKHREIYFICRDDRVSDICAKHGFEEVKNVRVLKRTVQ